MKTFRIVTLGCRVNQCESEAVAQRLREAGWRPADSGRPADLCIVNTCTVTHKAAMQSRQMVRQQIRSHPGARVLVTGCYAQTEGRVLAEIEGVSCVLGHGEKHRIPEMAETVAAGKAWDDRIACGNIRAETRFRSFGVPAVGGRSRPFVKIQDGCDAFCTYCIVPHARGPSRSMGMEEVLRTVAGIRDAGLQEAVLTGIHLGLWGRDLVPESSLERLLDEIDRRRLIGRLRLSSIEPREWTDGMIDLISASPRFCRHFHMPLQSGDDTILRRMGRPYTGEVFAERVRKIIAAAPGAAVGVDVLVGFPGEDGAAHEATFQLLASLPVAYLHVFPYSPREGTPASCFPDRVPGDVVKARCRRLRRLSREKRLAFHRRHEGAMLDVVVESRRDRGTGRLTAMSDNYIPVLVEGSDEIVNTRQTVRVTRVGDSGDVSGVIAA